MHSGGVSRGVKRPSSPLDEESSPLKRVREELKEKVCVLTDFCCIYCFRRRRTHPSLAVARGVRQGSIAGTFIHTAGRRTIYYLNFECCLDFVQPHASVLACRQIISISWLRFSTLSVWMWQILS